MRASKSGISGFFGRLRIRFAFVIALAMLPAGVVAVLQALSNIGAEEEARHELLANEVRVRASDERDLLVQVRETLKSVGRAALTELNSTGSCDVAVDEVPQRNPWMSRIVVIDNDGMALCGASSGFSVADLPSWRDDFMARPRFMLGGVRNSRLSGAEILLSFLPISVDQGDTIAIASGIKLSSLRKLSETTEQGRRPFALVGNNGTAVVNRDLGVEGWLPDDIETAVGRGTLLVSAEGADGIARNYITYPLVPGEIWAVTGEPRAPLSTILLSREGLPILMPIILWLIAVGVAFVAIDRMVTRHIKHLRRCAREIGAGNFDTPVRSLEGAPLEIEMLGDSIDQMATDLANRETRMQELLSNQKSLLLEVHHRVKNNLQMISSLMNIQLRRVTNDVDKGMLQLVQDRIHGLALVHQNLYSTERLDHVALDQLVNDVCQHLCQSLRPLNSEVDMKTELDPVTVDASIGTPVALFVTEAMGNVFKHASAQGHRSEIGVHLKGCDDSFVLTIRNQRLPGKEGVAGRGPSGLGYRLMEGFARQLSGSFDQIDSDEEFGVVLTAPIRDQSKEFEIRRRNNPLDSE